MTDSCTARYDTFNELPSFIIWIADEHVSIENASAYVFGKDAQLVQPTTPTMDYFVKVGNYPPVLVTDCRTNPNSVLDVVKNVTRTPASILQRNAKRLFMLLNADVLPMNIQKALRLLIDDNGSHFGCIMTITRLNNIDNGLRSRALVVTPKLRNKYFGNDNCVKSKPQLKTYTNPEDVFHDAMIDHRIAQAANFVNRHDCLATDHTSELTKVRCIKDLKRLYNN